MLEHFGNVKRKIQLSLKFSFRFNFGFGQVAKTPHEDYHLRSGGGTHMAEDWASRTADELENQKKAEQQKEERATQKRRIMEEQGPLIWKRVFAGIQGQVAEFNKREGDTLLIDREDQNSITIVSKVGARQRNVTARLGKDYTISFYGEVTSDHSAGRSASFAMYVGDDNGIILREDWTDKSIDDVVASILDALI
jgi:hypothetical protein